jgi:hypothetical protein
MEFDASFHHGIDSIVFCGHVVATPLSVLLGSFVPLLFGFRASLLSHQASTSAEHAAQTFGRIESGGPTSPHFR